MYTCDIGVDTFITDIYILMQELCFEFKKT